MINNMNTLKRLTDAIQWDVPVKKRTRPNDEILEGTAVRIDKEHITAVGIEPVARDLLDGLLATCMFDSGENAALKLTPPKDIAHACVPIAPLKKWLAAFTGDAIHIHLKGGVVLIRGTVDDIEVAGLVAERIEWDD